MILSFFPLIHLVSLFQPLFRSQRSSVETSAGPAVFAVELKASGDDLDLTAATFDDCGSVSETSGDIAGAIRVTLTLGGGSFTPGTFLNYESPLKYAVMFVADTYDSFANSLMFNKRRLKSSKN